MRSVYFVVPALVAAAFGGYYTFWSADEAVRMHAKRDEALRLRNAAVFRDEYEGRDGRREAEADLKSGRVVILSYGLPVKWYAEYDELMRQRYGIEDRWIAGCIVTKPLADYAEAYNRVMNSWIVGKFGADAFKGVAIEAQHIYEQKNARSGANQSLDPTPALGMPPAGQESRHG